jgi:hypothetical protein
MFVRVKKIGVYEYLYLVENAREGGLGPDRSEDFGQCEDFACGVAENRGAA